MSIFSKDSGDFLSTIRDEIVELRDEIAKVARKKGLLRREPTFAEKAADQWHQSRDFMRDQAQSVARTAREHPAGLSLGSLLILGAVGYGIYSMCNREEERDYVRVPESGSDLDY